MSTEDASGLGGKLEGTQEDRAMRSCETKADGGGEATRAKRIKLTRDERRALRRVAKCGKAGATAREIGGSEDEGLEAGARLVKHKLVAVTRTNRFMLVKYVGTVVPGPISWDE
jgi:hypothetical protein